MATYDVSSVGSQVVGIAGMGIGLGILAGTARGITDTMYPNNRRRRPPVRKMRRYKPRYAKPYRPRGGPYDWHLRR